MTTEREREAFEADMLPKLDPAGAAHPFFSRMSEGRYTYEWMQSRWEGWQARAALASQAQPTKAEDAILVYLAAIRDDMRQQADTANRLLTERLMELAHAAPPTADTERKDALLRQAMEALRPFANYACTPPCGCHNCHARTVAAAITAELEQRT